VETTRGPQPDNDRLKSDLGPNVVHFPRDWFGPTEDLIPMGSRAAEQRADDDPSTAGVVAADGFWSGALIDEPLAAPEPGAPRAWRWAPRAWYWAPRLALPRRLAIPVGALAAALICTVVAFQALATKAHLSTPSVSAVAYPEASLVQALGGGASGSLGSHARAGARRDTDAARGIRRTHRGIPIPVSARTGVGVSTSALTESHSTNSYSGPAAGTSVGVDETAATVSGTGDSGSGASNAGATNSGAGSSGSGSSGSGSSGSSDSSPSAATGPQGPGAPFGPGHLG
jgi:hypothetical protein